MTTSRVAEPTTVQVTQGPLRSGAHGPRPALGLVAGRWEGRSAGDAAGLDQLGEAVLVVLGLEPLDLGVDLRLEVAPQSRATFRHSSMYSL